ncbi:FAD binding domain-containing protein [Pleurostoma richardsiae]|uniref:FAD binding domain-containing protein n=1 Tax=Pleurostoma richardsiae TaxID=41990 RepID=A0AA38R7D5_9PEZI|nr:FAD binding domain-containing protein [Pleurostoma richardsiae]
MPAAVTPPPAFAPLRDTKVFSPFQLGRLSLSHRIVQAPCTRMRADFVSKGVFLPNDKMVTYYGQRASAGGLQLTEATDISLNSSAYPGTPGVFTAEQLAGWKKVTDAVHAKGGFIFAQLWHTGRATGPGMRTDGQSLSSTAKPMAGKYLDGTDTAEHPPRAMTVPEIHEVTAEWAAAAKRAVEEAGFDGVEVHSANGYLLEQFLHDNINDRTDEYGGSVENRCRFTLEVVEAVCAAIGADRVGVRLSPYNYFQDTKDSDPNKHWAYLCGRIATLPSQHRPAYVHMVEPRFDEVLDEEQKMAALSEYTASTDALSGADLEKEKAIVPSKKPVNSLTPFRRILKEGGVAFMAAGTYNRDNAVPKLENDLADLVAFGRQFIANPDLVERLRNGWPLNAYDRSTFYGADPPEKGYLDYPFYEEDVKA